MKTVIKNVHIIAMDKGSNEYRNGSIAIEDDKIIYVGDGSISESFKDADIIDGRGMLALPGFINAHTHVAMTMLRGHANDLPLWEWLTERIWPLEDKLQPGDTYWLSLLGIAEMIASGTTTFLDMYMFMNDTVAAVEESGIRAVLSRGMMGRDELTPVRLRETMELVNMRGAADGRINAMLGPHAIYTCSPDLLNECRQIALDNNVAIHIHLSETLKEVEDCKASHGKTPVELLRDLGIFDVPVVAAHCVHLTDHDLDIIKEYDVKPVHCPISNMKLASGFAPIDKMLERGICVSLGTDGAASNNNLSIFKEMSVAALITKGHAFDPTAVPAKTALEMATINGARALMLEDEIGSLEAGKKADIILIDTSKPHYQPKTDIISNIVYSGYSSDVDTVIINGRVLYKNKEFTGLDLPMIYSQVEKIAARIIG